jgi:hypothetical protein
VLAKPRVRERLESTGTTPVLDSTPASTRAFLDREFALYQNIVRRIGLKLDYMERRRRSDFAPLGIPRVLSAR